MKHKIAMIGGSLREQIVYDRLKENGYSVYSYGMEKEDDRGPFAIEECLRDADVLILPVRSNDPDMLIDGNAGKDTIGLNENILRHLSEGALIYCGAASDGLRNIAKKTGHLLKEIMDYDPVAVPNAVLTAEGALSHIMNLSEKSLADNVITIFGYGRVGKACAEIFCGAGARVVVFCRKDSDIRHGREKGFDMRYYEGACSVLTKTDWLVNTVPALVIDEKMIRCMKNNARMIDLASSPGGIDFDAAKKLGISAKLLPGIPGKYAPLSAGKILADYYLNEMKNLWGGEVL